MHGLTVTIFCSLKSDIYEKKTSPISIHANKHKHTYWIQIHSLTARNKNNTQQRTNQKATKKGEKKNFWMAESNNERMKRANKYQRQKATENVAN